ncbi:MAG: hypothetical protein H6509_02540 [Bryobacterales bacterium]|nr:hypothetical protein [Acidobacteriota bacterium]MCB9383465.1 hypothetical protein [Bryobacterales bacterium]
MPQPNNSLKNKSTEELKQYWDFVERTAKEVDAWPAWKRGEADAKAQSNGCSEMHGPNSVKKQSVRFE